MLWLFYLFQIIFLNFPLSDLQIVQLRETRLEYTIKINKMNQKYSKIEDIYKYLQQKL